MGDQNDQFDALRSVVREGKVLVPGSEGFDESLKRWSDTCIKPAAVVVKPANAIEVSEVIKFATTNKIPLVVKGGGHSTSGTSASDGGLVIDLGLMRSVKVDAEAKTVTFGGGSTWEDVDDECWKYGLATVGGTVNDTGVGGLTLGGGYGWLSPKYGLVCDNLVTAELVLADGRIVQVSKNEHPDLFWGIRGAGQSFGVATSFTLRAYDQGKVYMGPVVYPIDALPTLVDFVNFMHDHQDQNSALIFSPTCAPPDNHPALMSIIFYNGSEEEGKKYFKPLLDVAVANMAEAKPYPEANTIMSGAAAAGHPPRRLQGGATFVPPLKKDDVEDAISKFFPFVKENGLENGSLLLWEILPNKKVREVGLQDTAFAARDSIYHISPLWQWMDPDIDDTVRAFNRIMVAHLKETGGIKNGVTQYNNYDGDQLEPEKAFGPNVQRLQDIKMKYDPENVFYKWHGFFPRV